MLDDHDQITTCIKAAWKGINWSSINPELKEAFLWGNAVLKAYIPVEKAAFYPQKIEEKAAIHPEMYLDVVEFRVTRQFKKPGDCRPSGQEVTGTWRGQDVIVVRY